MDQNTVSHQIHTNEADGADTDAELTEVEVI